MPRYSPKVRRSKSKSFKVSGAVPIKGLAFAPMGSTETVYEPIFAKMNKMRLHGKNPVCVLVAVPKGVTPTKFQARLSSAIANAVASGKVVVPKGCRFKKRTTTDGKVAIILSRKR